METKTELRERLRFNRREMPDDFRKKNDGELFQKFISLPEYGQCRLLLTYLSSPYEIDTRRIIAHAFVKGIKVAVPKVSGRGIMTFRFINGFDDLERFSPSMQQPKDYCAAVTNFDGGICVVPALAYDRNGYRLGYGGGYYDRFLESYTGVSAGMCYKENVMQIPTEPHDIPVQKLLISGE